MDARALSVALIHPYLAGSCSGFNSHSSRRVAGCVQPHLQLPLHQARSAKASSRAASAAPMRNDHRSPVAHNREPAKRLRSAINGQSGHTAPNAKRIVRPGCYCRACSTTGGIGWLVPCSYASFSVRSCSRGEHLTYLSSGELIDDGAWWKTRCLPPNLPKHTEVNLNIGLIEVVGGATASNHRREPP